LPLFDLRVIFHPQVQIMLLQVDFLISCLDECFQQTIKTLELFTFFLELFLESLELYSVLLCDLSYLNPGTTFLRETDSFETL
jgi:hypothetical protein